MILHTSTFSRSGQILRLQTTFDYKYKVRISYVLLCPFGVWGICDSQTYIKYFLLSDFNAEKSEVTQYWGRKDARYCEVRLISVKKGEIWASFDSVLRYGDMPDRSCRHRFRKCPNTIFSKSATQRHIFFTKHMALDGILSAIRYSIRYP